MKTKQSNHILFRRELNRKQWWQFWKPKYYYPELEGEYELKVEAGTSAPKGRVVTVTTRAEYDFEKASKPREGGRVVKLMPRQLKKIKDGQEVTRDV